MPQGSGRRREVVAAGVVAFRPGRRVLLVHRPRYDDWSFPKGKLDPGEGPVVAAVREVEEETGLRVRLGPPLSVQHYPVGGGGKSVHYWVGRVVGDDDVSGYRANDEIDDVAWVPYDEALARLSYPRDRATLAEALAVHERCRTLVVLRHAKARPRKEWPAERPDRERPLTRAGKEQARLLVPVLAAYDATRVVSSSSTRCLQTVRPWADSTGARVEALDGLSEEDATAESVGRVVDDLLADPHGAVLCSHRLVLPLLLAALGLPETELPPAGLVAVHHRTGRVVAVEVLAGP